MTEPEIKIQGDNTLEGDVFVFYKTQLEFVKDKDMYVLKKSTNDSTSSNGLKNINFIFRPSKKHGNLEEDKYYVVNNGDTIYENKYYDEFKLFQDPKTPGIVKLLYDNHEHEKNKLLTEHKQIEESLKGTIESMRENMNNLETEVQKKYETEIENASIIPPFVNDNLLKDIDKNMSDVNLKKTAIEIQTYLDELNNLKDKIATLSTNVNSKLNETTNKIQAFNTYSNKTKDRLDVLNKYEHVKEILSEFKDLNDKDLNTLNESAKNINNNYQKTFETYRSEYAQKHENTEEEEEVKNAVDLYFDKLMNDIINIASYFGINDITNIEISEISENANPKIINFVRSLLTKIITQINYLKQNSVYEKYVDKSPDFKNIEIFKDKLYKRHVLLNKQQSQSLQTITATKKQKKGPTHK